MTYLNDRITVDPDQCGGRPCIRGMRIRLTDVLDLFSASAVRELGLRHAKDFEIFQAAREANAVVLTKDADFPHLLAQHGPPPRVIWLTCGNTSNENLRCILHSALRTTISLLASGESIVEITGLTK